MPVVQANRTFTYYANTRPAVVHEGDLYDAGDPIVRVYADKFSEPRVKTSVGYHLPEPEPLAKPRRSYRKTEAATADPGEVRDADLGDED